MYREDCTAIGGEVPSSEGVNAAPSPVTARPRSFKRINVSETQHAQLVAWLEDQGHTEEQIQKILAKVAEYDAKTVHESVFDSISSGTLGLDKLIEEALAEDGDAGD